MGKVLNTLTSHVFEICQVSLPLMERTDRLDLNRGLKGVSAVPGQLMKSVYPAACLTIGVSQQHSLDSFRLKFNLIIV